MPYLQPTNMLPKFASLIDFSQINYGFCVVEGCECLLSSAIRAYQRLLWVAFKKSCSCTDQA